MTMKAPSLATIKVLFARSHNQCAFPNCLSPVVEDTDTVTAEICHIRALSPGGPRYDKSQTPEERNLVANLVLMCGRHHKIIDTEARKYTATVLLKIKEAHEESGPAKIIPRADHVAKQLLLNYTHINVIGNSGNVAIQSPGAIQAKSITFKNTRTRVSVAPPMGSIGADRAITAYCQHLIDRYQDYQKADWTGKTDFKYQAIHAALKREYGTWKLLDESRFHEVVAFLQKRIDATLIGKRNRAKGHPNYSSFETWQRDS